MSVEFTELILGSVIYGMQTDCKTFEDRLELIFFNLNRITTQGNVNGLVDMLNEGTKCSLPSLNISYSDMMTLDLLCIAFLHKDNHDMSWAIAAINKIAMRIPNDMVRCGGTFALAVLGDRSAQDARAILMKKQGIRTVREYEQYVIYTLVLRLACGY